MDNADSWGAGATRTVELPKGLTGGMGRNHRPALFCEIENIIDTWQECETST